MSPDIRYSFVELISAEAAVVALQLSGIQFNGANLKIARPKTYGAM
jgi:hypothetical protein